MCVPIYHCVSCMCVCSCGLVWSACSLSQLLQLPCPAPSVNQPASQPASQTTSEIASQTASQTDKQQVRQPSSEIASQSASQSDDVFLIRPDVWELDVFSVLSDILLLPREPLPPCHSNVKHMWSRLQNPALTALSQSLDAGTHSSFLPPPASSSINLRVSPRTSHGEP